MFAQPQFYEELHLLRGKHKVVIAVLWTQSICRSVWTYWVVKGGGSARWKATARQLQTHPSRCSLVMLGVKTCKLHFPLSEGFCLASTTWGTRRRREGWKRDKGLVPSCSCHHCLVAADNSILQLLLTFPKPASVPPLWGTSIVNGVPSAKVWGPAPWSCSPTLLGSDNSDLCPVLLHS